MKKSRVFRLNKSFNYFILLVMLALLGAACGGGGTTGGSTPPIGDLSGTWQVTGTESSPTQACDGASINMVATIVQSGSNLTSNGSDGSVLSGTISGNTVSMSGTYPEGGGTTVVSSATVTVAADCNSFSGSDVWSWTDGTFSCSGTSVFNGVRLSGSGCGTTIPAAPQNIQAASADSQVTVSWNSVSGTTSYNIYWNTSGGVTTADNQIAGATSPYVHASLTNGTAYYYIVTAVNSAGESVPSSEVSATPQVPVGLPAAPQNVQAASGNTQVTVSWNPVSGATLYNIYWNTTGGVTTSDNQITGVTSPYVHTGRANGTTYYYIVTAVNSLGESVPSSEVSVMSGGSSGALDTTFGTTGMVTTDLGADDSGQAVAVDSTNKIIVAGQFRIAASGDFALVRYNTDGTLDNTFGASGKVITNLGADDRGRAAVIDSNGKILVGGDSLVTASDFAVARYNSNGTLDTSFNSNGFVTTDFNNTAEPAMDITIDLNGKIVAAGFAHNGTNYDFAVVRYNSDGSLDTSFNTNGMVTTDLGGDDRISGVATYPNGNVIVVGRTGSASDYDFAIVRYNNDGTLDTTFGTNGVIIIDLGGTNDRAREITFDLNGKIVIVGRSNGTGSNDFVVMRFNDDGSPDTTFGTNGMVITNIGGNDRGRAVVIDSSDRIIVLGTSNSQGGNDFAVIRYNIDGSLDTTFDTNGIAYIDFGGDDRGADIVLDSNGMIIVGGRSDTGSGNDFAAARLLP